MPITTRHKARTQLQSRTASQLWKKQQISYFDKLPQEVRDMIYDLVFADDSEIKLLHPLMRTSRQLREESTAAFARNVGPRATFYMACITDYRNHRTGRVITIQGTDNTPFLLPETRSVKAKSRRHSANPYQPWQSFRRSELGKQMVPRMHHIKLDFKMQEWIEITVTFNDGAAPEISVKTSFLHSFAATRAHYVSDESQKVARRTSCVLSRVDRSLGQRSERRLDSLATQIKK